MLEIKKNALSDLHHLRIVTQKELRLLVPYTPQHILRLEKAGKFPARIRLGMNRVGWLLTEIEAWITSRRAVSPPPASPDQPFA
jgi:prophage regulatory protein